MPDEDLDIIIEAKAEGEHQIRDLKDAFDDLRRSVLEAAATIAAAAPAMEATTVATAAFTTGTREATTSAMGFGAALESVYDGLPPAIPVIIAYATALTVVLAPALAYTAGLAAALSLGLVALGGFGALGAGIVALVASTQGWLTASKDLATAQGQLNTATNAHEQAVRSLQEAEVQLQNTRKPTEAQLMHIEDLQKKVADTGTTLVGVQNRYDDALRRSNNPLSTLVDHLEEMGRTLGTAAVPLATQLLGWVDSLIPEAEKLGKTLLDWAGDRLPKVLPMATLIVFDLLDALKNLGKVVGPIFDDLIQHPAKYQKAFHDAATAITEIIKGILGDLTQLATWWANHPEMQRDAEFTFQKIGDAISISIRALERMAQDVDAVVGALDRLRGARSALVVQGGLVGAFGSILPQAQSGTLALPGPMGQPQLVVAHGGERITPASGSGRSGGGGYEITMNIYGGDSQQIAAEVDRRLSRLLTAT